jgi:hypothetical protein
MALSFSGGLFQNADPATDDSRRLLSSPAAECVLSLSGGSSEAGSIFDIFDDDTSTFHSYVYTSAVNNTDTTYTSTIDFLKVITAKTLWVLYSSYNDNGKGAYGTVTLQISTDGSSWTDLGTAVAPYTGTAVNTFGNYTASNKRFRYVRLSLRAQNGVGGGTSVWGARFYELQYTSE